jgi:histidinol-phosphatase
VSDTNRLADAVVLCTNAERARQRGPAWDQIAAASRVQRGWGDCYGYALVATGRADVMFDPAMHPWDCAPLMPILAEAGGTFTDWRGTATIWGKDAFATNGRLFQEVFALLNQNS